MKKLFSYVFASYLISWFIWLPLVLQSKGMSTFPVLPKYHHYLGSFGPMIAAIMCTFIFDGREGLIKLFKGVFLWRVKLKWYFVVLVVPVLVVFVSGMIIQIFSGENFTMSGFGNSDEFTTMSPVAFFIFNLVTFGIGEETGWRGYALVQLQKKFSALLSTIFLTLIWACWHIPAFLYRSNYSSMNFAGVMGFFFSLFMGAILLTWIFNSTRGSIFIAALYHAMVEMMFVSKNISPAVSTIEGIIFMIAAIAIIYILKPKNLSTSSRLRIIEA